MPPKGMWKLPDERITRKMSVGHGTVIKNELAHAMEMGVKQKPDKKQNSAAMKSFLRGRR